MADILITIVVGLCVAGMAALGVYVSFVPLPSSDAAQPFLKRRAVWVSAVFVLLTVVVVSLSTIQTYRNGKQQAELAGTLSDVKGTLETTRSALQASALSQEFMKGQLSGLSMMVGKLGSDGNAGTASLAKALQQISSEPQHARGVEPPAIQRMTNRQLQTKVLGFVNLLRKEAAEYMTQSETEPVQARPQGVPSQDEMQKAFQQRTNRDIALMNSFDLQLQQNYIGDATEYRDELLRRLGPQTPEKQQSTFWMGGVGYWQALGTADYLEHLAKQLPQ